MEKITLPARLRSSIGKGAAGKLRREGFLPAVLYGGKEREAISLTLNDHEVREVLKHHAGKKVLINLVVDKEGQKEYLVLLQEMQTHPYKKLIRHMDFLQISLDQKTKVEVALSFQGRPVGKAILETHLRQIEVECLPDHIPGEIVIDVSGMEVGQSVSIGDLQIPDGVTVLGDAGRMVVAVVEKAELPTEEEAVKEEAAEGKPAEESSQE